MPSISVPPAVNYPNLIVPVPCRVLNSPPEQPQIAQLEVLWGTMGGSNNSVFVNLQNQATLDFSQICAISVDNSECGGDVSFVFPDTGETTQIPAYTPKAIIPIFTNSRQFYVVGEGVQSEDVTNISILNFLPPPVVVPTSQEQNVSSASAILTSATGSTQLIPSNVDGTLENVYLFFFSVTVGPSSCTWTLEDGNSKVLSSGECLGTTALTAAPILSLQDCKLRFQNGISLNVSATSGGVTQFINATLCYRTP